VNLARRLVAEGVATAFLLAIVIGSGIMGERLANGNDAIALLANSFATGCGLAVIIAVFAPVSGAHLNPAVTLMAAAEGELSWSDVAPYIAIQIIAAFCGVAVAHLMFGEPLFSQSVKARAGLGQWFGEAVATFGLITVIFACVRQRIALLPVLVASYIAAAYWFTSSTSFANPAVTLARAASNTFAGIRPADVPGFLLGQATGTLLAIAFVRWLMPAGRSTSR
jgi:glycerol uptake facilitator-like aquaporin